MKRLNARYVLLVYVPHPFVRAYIGVHILETDRCVARPDPVCSTLNAVRIACVKLDVTCELCKCACLRLRVRMR